MRRPDPAGKRIGNAEIRTGDALVYVGEEIPETPTAAPSPTHKPTCIVQLYVPDCDAVFQAAVQAEARAASPPADILCGAPPGAGFCILSQAGWTASSVAVPSFLVNAQIAQNCVASGLRR